MKTALRAVYRNYWFYISPTKYVIRTVIRRYFSSRISCSSILELGGGTSMMRATLEDACRPGMFVSSDIEPTDATTVVCAAEALPFPDDSFDLVVAFELMEHLPDTHSFLSEVNRVGRPGGHVLLSLPFLFGVHDYKDFYRFTPMGLERVLNDSGLKMVVMKEAGGTWYALTALAIEYVRTVALPQSKGWRSQTWGRRAHLITTSMLTAPLAALAWVAFGFDAVVDRKSKNPSGLVAIAEIGQPLPRRSDVS